MAEYVDIVSEGFAIAIADLPEKAKSKKEQQILEAICGTLDLKAEQMRLYALQDVLAPAGSIRYAVQIPDSGTSVHAMYKMVNHKPMLF